MKKLAILTLAVALIGVLGAEAYAYYGPRGGMNTPRGGMYGSTWKQGRGPGVRWDATNLETCPYCGYVPRNAVRPGWNAQGQPGTAPQALQMISEDNAQEIAEAYVEHYLTGYTVEKIEKDNRRPLYFVTIKGANDAEQVLTIHGFAGQVMHVLPQNVETPAE